MWPGVKRLEGANPRFSAIFACSPEGDPSAFEIVIVVSISAQPGHWARCRQKRIAAAVLTFHHEGAAMAAAMVLGIGRCDRHRIRFIRPVPLADASPTADCTRSRGGSARPDPSV